MAVKVVDLASALRVDEGQKLTIYQDTEGYWTVGIGHLLTKQASKTVAIAVLDKLVGRRTKGTITETEAQNIFNQDKGELESKVLANTKLKPIYISLSTVRKQAVLNMAFQMGISGTASFENSLTLVANGSYSVAKANLLKSKWASQTPNRAARVIDTLITSTFDSYNK